MKKILMAVLAVFLTGALLAPAMAQEAGAGQAEAAAAAPAPAPETPPAPEMKKKAKKKPAKKAAVQPAVAAPAEAPVPAAAAGTASGEPAPAAAPAPVPAPAAVEAVPAPQAETAAPAPAAEPVPAAARRSSCPACFQTLLTGYGNITAELKPWMTEMEGQAADLDQRLSDIQKQIDGKDDAIEKARLITDKKESKAAVKNLGKERKALLKDYSAATDQKEDFYKQFSKEVEKRTLAHLKLLEDSLQATLSAASD